MQIMGWILAFLITPSYITNELSFSKILSGHGIRRPRTNGNKICTMPLTMSVSLNGYTPFQAGFHHDCLLINIPNFPLQKPCIRGVFLLGI